MFVSYRWNCCFCIEKMWTSQGLRRPPGPPLGALPVDPTRALKRTSWPHTARLTHVTCFDFLNLLINGAPSHPLLTGTLKQSYATEQADEDPVIGSSCMVHPVIDGLLFSIWLSWTTKNINKYTCMNVFSIFLIPVVHTTSLRWSEK